MAKFSEKELEAVNKAKAVLDGPKAKMRKMGSLIEQISSVEEKFRYYSSPKLSWNGGGGSNPRPACDIVSKLVSFSMDKIAELNAEKEEIEEEINVFLKAILEMPMAKYQMWIVRVHIGGESWRSLTEGCDRGLAAKKSYLEFWDVYTKIKT